MIRFVRNVELFSSNIRIYIFLQLCAIQKMLVTFRVWLVQVDGLRFQQDCLHHPQGILAQLELHLPKLANAKSDSTVQRLKVSGRDTALYRLS